MATLIENLSYIYDIKQDIKEVIGTNSNLFSEYPQLIQEAIDEVPAGYTYVSGTYNITENGTVDVTSYASAYVSVPSSGITPSGDYMSNISEWETVIDGENPSEMTVNLTSPDISEYETITLGLQGQLPENASYIYENGLVEVNPLEYGQYNSYIYVDVPTGGVTPEGTYYVTDNGTYDISTYEYVDVQVDGGPAVESYTWSNVPASGNYRVAPSAEYRGLAFYVYKSGSNPWSSGTYRQILSDRQFAYTIPSSFTATRWNDYATNTYLLNSDSVQDYVYSCDPSNYDSLTDINNMSQSSSEHEGKFELECYEMYGDINLLGSSNKLYPAGGDVHYFCNIKTINDEQGRTGYLTTGGGVLGNIPETSYFGNTVPYTYLNGRSWETIVEVYQDVIMLKDIVGPVAGSEVYLNECDDVWANWMNGWNGGTTTYNSSTGNLELTFNNNYVVSGNGKNANIYQLEYRIENGGSSHMIGLSCENENQAIMDSTHLSGTTYISSGLIMQNGPSTGLTGTNFGYIDESELAQEGYTNYDVNFKLVIPRDMWLYGSTNFNTCWVEWTITPDSSALTDDVTALQTSVGTSWYTGNRISGSGSDGYWATTVQKSNKATSNLENYKIYEINVTGTTSGTHNFVPDLNSPDSLSINNLSGSWEGPLVDREDQNGKQMFTLDTTDLPGTATLQVDIRIPEKVLDPDNSEYMTCHIDYQIIY